MTTGPPGWGRYLAAHPGATVYHDPRWGQVMKRAYGARPYYLTARRGARIAGVLPLVGQRSWLFGRFLCSVPYADAAGLLCDDDDARRALLAEAAALRDRAGASWVELRQLEALAPELPARTDKITMWLDLPAGADAMWKQLRTKVRTKVRKTLNAPLEVHDGGAALLPDFYAIYAMTMRDLGSPAHSLRYFRLLLAAYPDEARVFVVRSADGPLAASFAFTDRRAFHVPWSGSDKRYRQASANRRLYWAMLAHAADAGAPRFDFGRSTKDSGTHEFKREWRPREVPLHWHFLLPPGGEVPELRPDSAKYRLMVDAWKKLPLPVANLLGPRIIAKLP